jgi:hypothetical protein
MKIWKEGNKLIFDGEGCIEMSIYKKPIVFCLSATSGNRQIFKPGIIWKNIKITQKDKILEDKQNE